MGSLGVYHRDINPDNLMYDPTLDVIKLIDFGFATKKIKAEFSGTLMFAAEDIVTTFQSNIYWYKVNYISRYDMESYIKCLYFIKYQPTNIIQLHKFAPTTIVEYSNQLDKIKNEWNALFSSMPSRFAILKSLRNGMELQKTDFENLLQV